MLVVTLSVPTGQSTATQSLQTTVSTAADASGSGPGHQLQQPLSIALTKTPVWAVYPLTYAKSFNAKPYEIVVMTTDCKDGAYQSDATCGWFSNADGTHVADSQGFCCPCDAQATWQQSVLGGATDLSRGNVNCDLFTANMFLNGLPASAHCLRMAPQWYAGYSIGVAGYEFTLSVSITPVNSSQPGEVLSLSPATLVAVNGAQTVAAELMGDLGGFQESPVLSQKMLFIPIPNSNSNTSGDPSTWPLLDTSAVSLDGSGCDKPGVMFSGFRDQPSKCSQPAGTCLANQLTDIVNADAARMAAGNVPVQNLAALAVGQPQLHNALPGAPSPTLKRLALPSSQLRNSIVVLTLSADSIRFVVNYSPGRIVSASLVNFQGNATSSFVALSGNGLLSATIVNNGTIAASYYLSVLNCSAGVALIPSPGAIAMAAGGVYTQQWACSVQDDKALQRNCTVVLQDARFITIDTRLVLFYTNATVYDTIPHLDSNAVGTGPGPPQGGGGGGCSAACPNLMNVMCALLNFCWGRLFEGLIIYAVIAAAVYWALVKCGPCRLAATASHNLGQVGKQRQRQEVALDQPSPPRHALPPKAHRSPLRPSEQQLIELEAALSDAELSSLAHIDGRRGAQGRGHPGRGPTRLEAMLEQAARQQR